MSRRQIRKSNKWILAWEWGNQGAQVLGDEFASLDVLNLLSVSLWITRMSGVWKREDEAWWWVFRMKSLTYLTGWERSFYRWRLKRAVGSVIWGVCGNFREKTQNLCHFEFRFAQCNLTELPLGSDKISIVLSLTRIRFRSWRNFCQKDDEHSITLSLARVPFLLKSHPSCLGTWAKWFSSKTRLVHPLDSVVFIDSRNWKTTPWISLEPLFPFKFWGINYLDTWSIIWRIICA